MTIPIHALEAPLSQVFESGNCRILVLDAPEIARIARPGQFIDFSPPEEEGEFFLPRPMSVLFARPEQGELAFAYKEVGRGTRRLAHLAPGDRLRIIGPLGTSWAEPLADHDLLLVGGGIGFAPLYFQAEQLVRGGREAGTITVVLAARNAAELAYVEAFEELGVQVRMATDDGSLGHRGHAMSLAEELLAEPRRWEMQACGPMPMLAAAARAALRRGLRTQVSLESPMGCGVGVCLGCSVPAARAAGSEGPNYLRVCSDGPVFAAGDLDWASLDPPSAVKPPRAPRSEAPDLAGVFAGIPLASPVLVSSGTFGYGSEYSRLVDLSKVGAIITKSISERPRMGNPPPRIRELPTGMLNAIGLQNVGVDAFLRDKVPFFADLPTRLIANVVGHDEDEYLRVLDRLAGCALIDGIELNLSCPNVDGGLRLSSDPVTIERFVRSARDHCPQPLIVKLTPNVTDIAAVARAAEAGGADALSMINTLVGMAIDLEHRRPWIGRGTAGYSGPGIKPVALAMTWKVAQAVSIPILAGGGISSGRDACEFLVAGASAVSVGTATFVDPRTAERIAAEIAGWLGEQGCSSVHEIVGSLRVGGP